jgi:hypothetical protein
MARLRTAAEVIDALGGTYAVGRLVKRDPSHVSRWRKRDSFPPQVFLQALERRGHSAPPILWGQVALEGLT